MELTDLVGAKHRRELDTKDFHAIIGDYSPEVLSLLVLYYNSQGLVEKGFSLLTSTLKQIPEKWEFYELLVSLSIKNRKMKEAEKELLKAQSLFPDNPRILGSLGELYFSEEKFVPAVECLEKCIEHNKEGIDLLYLASSRLALFLEKESKDQNDFQDRSKVQQELLKFKELNPELADHDYLKGETLLAQGNYFEAFKSFQNKLNRYLDKRIEFNRFHKLLFSFYFQPEKFELKELKSQIYELEDKFKRSSFTIKELNRLGYLHLIFFIHLFKSAEEQLEKALLLDSEFESAFKTKRLLGDKKKEIFSLIDKVIF